MSIEELQQNSADATGLIYDRTMKAPKSLGQAFLVSRNRLVCCATSVSAYTEAPWALGVNFIHPNVTIGLRSIVLHPEFDKKAARAWYLSQTGAPGEQCVLNNDIAILSLDMQLPDMAPDKVAELNRALSLPFSSAGVEASGNIRGDEFLTVLHQIVQTRKEGLLTLLDPRNIPMARLQISSNGVTKAYYKNLLGEMAFFELVYRQPAAGYSFQTGDTGFNWGQVRDITAPTDALVQEAMRRSGEIAGAFSYLGGAEARYATRIENYDVSTASESIQWFAERLWGSIDGYLTLDNVPERCGADTFTTLQAMREMVNKAQISQINRLPFHQNGMLGTPLISHTDFEVHAWDPLQGFFVDPVSGRPVWLAGNFFGVANALQPKNMLHTIAMPPFVPGAMILKDYKLIGLHSGPHAPRAGQPIPPVKCYQMMWMGALLDITSSKKGREGDASMVGAEAMSGLRSKGVGDERPATTPESLQSFICPKCHATNTQLGPCFNCGTEIVPPESEPEVPSQGKMDDIFRDLEAKTKLPRKQLMLIGGGLVVLLLVLVSSMIGGGSPPPAQAPVLSAQDQVHPNSEKAMKIAVDYAGFKATAIPGYWYEETLDTTKPNLSFGMNSEQGNQKILFVIFDTTAPVDKLDSFVGLPPYTDVIRATPEDLKTVKLDENNQLLGSGNLHWFVGRYARQEPPQGEDPNAVVLIGAFPSTKPGKSILVIGRGLTPGKAYDYKSTLWLCDQMASDFTASGNAERSSGSKKVAIDTSTSTAAASAPDKPLATDKELDAFAAHIQSTIQAKLKLPDDVQEEMKKKKPKGLKSSIDVGINTSDGSITKLDITQQSEPDSLTQALSKAINASAPFEDPPRTKFGAVDVVVSINKDQVKVERP